MSEQTERRSGRSTRMLVKALSAMLRGESVIVVAGTHIQALELAHSSWAWMEENGWTTPDPRIEVSHTRETISFGRGRVRFISYRSGGLAMLRRDQSRVEYWDHYALELQAEDSAKQARVDAMSQIEQLMKLHGWSRVELRVCCDGTHALPISPDGKPYVRP